ncbi:hypothetical protein PSR30_04345 [Pectobacterium carotovorum subsp. carotovorum]|uniref:hypothetical protein n=1 Tax=Pectobacterium carotovorum TaxID=554 RepID=UPI00236645A0|nr:hypothetical protein [Pectobacterium carotovorum]WDF99806.1 hypothetical protein PSR30_04345 [Pectobacterium carotovorum subsp. carotovorum]
MDEYKNPKLLGEEKGTEMKIEIEKEKLKKTAGIAQKPKEEPEKKEEQKIKRL